MDTRLLFAFWVWKNNKLRILICVCITITRKVRNLNIKLTVLGQTTGLSSPAACRERPSIMSTQERCKGNFPRVFPQAPAICGLGTSQARSGFFFCLIALDGIFYHEFIQMILNPYRRIASTASCGIPWEERGWLSFIIPNEWLWQKLPNKIVWLHLWMKVFLLCCAFSAASSLNTLLTKNGDIVGDIVGVH